MKRDINFFSTYQLKNHDKKSQNLYGYLFGGAVGLFVLGTFGVNQYQLMRVNHQISDLEEKLADPIIQEQIEESDRAYKIAELLEQYDSGLKSLVNKY